MWQSVVDNIVPAILSALLTGVATFVMATIRRLRRSRLTRLYEPADSTPTETSENDGYWADTVSRRRAKLAAFSVAMATLACLGAIAAQVAIKRFEAEATQAAGVAESSVPELCSPPPIIIVVNLHDFADVLTPETKNELAQTDKVRRKVGRKRTKRSGGAPVRRTARNTTRRPGWDSLRTAADDSRSSTRIPHPRGWCEVRL